MISRAETISFINTLRDVSFSFGSVKLNLYTMLQGLAAIIALLWIVRLFVAFIDRKLTRMRDLRPSNRALIVKITQIFLYVVVFLTALKILGISLTAFSVIGGALGVGVGFGLQKIASNFMSGIILLFEKSVEVGDLIELEDGTQGFIRLISARYTRIETPDGRDVIIPNEDFIIKRVVSLTHTGPRSRIDITIPLRHDADAALALRLLSEAALKVPRCLRDPEPMAHITGCTENGLMLTLYFWIDDVVEGRLEPRTQAYLTILELFREHRILMAVPLREIVPQTVLMAESAHAKPL